MGRVDPSFKVKIVWDSAIIYYAASNILIKNFHPMYKILSEIKTLKALEKEVPF